MLTGCALLPGYRFHLFFSKTGYQKKTIFRKLVVKKFYFIVFLGMFYVMEYTLRGYFLSRLSFGNWV